MLVETSIKNFKFPIEKLQKDEHAIIIKELKIIRILWHHPLPIELGLKNSTNFPLA